MPDDSVETVYGLVERAYLRMQAGEVLVQCLDAGSTRPMQSLVEGLVLAGSRSLNAVREILAEVNLRYTQLQRDQDQMFSDLENRLKTYQVQLGETHSPASIMRMSRAEMEQFLQRQGVSGENNLPECLTMLQQANELMSTVAHEQNLLDDLDRYLQDWLWVLVYQSAREELTNNLIAKTQSPFLS